MAIYTQHGGIHFNVIDDCDSLLTKFYNERDELLRGDWTDEELDKIDAKIVRLEQALFANNGKELRKILDEHFTMFKRYR